MILPDSVLVKKILSLCFCMVKKFISQSAWFCYAWKSFILSLKKCTQIKKFGLASFVNLDPKWCVTVISIVYVSSLITKMLNLCVHSYQIIDTTNLMKLCVCVVEDHTFMFPLYTECPDRTELSATLKTIFESNDFDFDSTISYKQWVSTDMTTLVTFEYCEWVYWHFYR